MIMSRKLIDVSELHILIDSVRISPAQGAMFLGFLIDCRLSWLPHITLKCSTAKRALHGTAGCLRRTWGCDKKRIALVYKSIVEPIILYGCAVWASFVRTKSDIKRLRSFQRAAAILITQAFKTAPTNALLILSNLPPIEHRVVEIAALRFLSWRGYPFSKTSVAAIVKFVPSLQVMQRTDASLRRYSLDSPPWRIPSSVVNLGSPDNVDLCPTREDALRIYVGSWRAVSHGFTVIVADVNGTKVLASQASSKNITLHQTLSRAMMTALQFIKDRSSHREIELFCTHAWAFSFAGYNRKLTDLEFSCFKTYMVITKFATVSFFCCHPTCNVPGMSLAKSQLLSTNVNNENMHSPNLVEG